MEDAPAHGREDRSVRRDARGLSALVVCALAAASALLATGANGATVPVGTAGVRSTPPVLVSRCPDRNAEVEDAASGAYVYAEWIGCATRGIGYARSIDGGRHFGAAMLLPGSTDPTCPVHCTFQSWDPAIAVSPHGIVYASFMVHSGRVSSPVVDASYDHGATFQRLGALPVPATSDPAGNWGDRDFIAVGPTGAIYVTWDYGPRASELQFTCSPIGSCSFTAGDLNAVIQRSTNGGKTWSAVHPISPGFPYGGADTAPIVIQPSGTLDVLYQAFPTKGSSHQLSPGTEYFTSSSNAGATWTTPIAVSAGTGTVSLTEWWIDGDIATDPSGTLYATWDTQSKKADVGWLSTSTNRGRTWSKPTRVTPATGTAEQLVEVTGVASRTADIAWQTPQAKQGYATYVRPFAVGRGWLTSGGLRVSTAYGNPKVWPGDTFGIVALPRGTRTAHRLPIAITWGSAIRPSKLSEIYSAVTAP